MSTHPNSPATVEIFGRQVTRIEYRGHQVVTFAMIDKLHSREDDAARKRFAENKTRFQEGVDYIVGNLSELRTAFPGVFPARGGGDITLLTQRGYFKVTRSFRDDQSWVIFDEMLDRYFIVQEVLDRFDFDASGQGELGLDPEGIRIFRSEMTRNASGLARNIESIKQAVLGYFHKAVQTSITAISNELSDVHRMSHKGFNTINNNVKSMDAKLDRLEAHFGPNEDKRPFFWSEWYTVGRIYRDLYGVNHLPRQGVLSSAISRSIDSFVLSSGRNFDVKRTSILTGKPMSIWHVGSVQLWFDQQGRQMIADHVARNTPKAPVLTLVKNDEVTP